MTGVAWDLDDYRDLLDAALAGGYRFSLFDDVPEPGRLFLRHDVDLTLDAAVVMARLEAELGIATTYLLMTESLFYNLASAEGAEAIAELRALGHRVGLHAVYPNVVLDDRFDRVVAWHNPEPAYMTEPIPGVVNEGVVLEYACQYAHPKADPVYSYLIRWKDGQVSAVSEAAFGGANGIELVD